MSDHSSKSPIERDRLAAISTWIGVFGIVSATVLGYYHVQRQTKPTAAAAAELPRGCEVPKSGEQLHITVVLRDGLLDITCRTAFTASPKKRTTR